MLKKLLCLHSYYSDRDKQAYVCCKCNNTVAFECNGYAEPHDDFSGAAVVYGILAVFIILGLCIIAGVL